MVLFSFCWGPLEFHPFRTSFYIHFLAQDSPNHINGANLEFLMHVVQLEVLISHGKTSSSHSEPEADGSPVRHIRDWWLEFLLTSFPRGGRVLCEQLFCSPSWTLGFGTPGGSPSPLPPRMVRRRRDCLWARFQVVGDLWSTIFVVA